LNSLNADCEFQIAHSEVPKLFHTKNCVWQASGVGACFVVPNYMCFSIQKTYVANRIYLCVQHLGTISEWVWSEMGVAFSTCGGRRGDTELWLGNLRERGYFEDLS